MGPISADKAEESAEELYQLLVANRFVTEGGVDYARKVILKTLGAGFRQANHRQAVVQLRQLQRLPVDR